MTTSYLDYDGLETLVDEIKARYERVLHIEAYMPITVTGLGSGYDLRNQNHYKTFRWLGEPFVGTEISSESGDTSGYLSHKLATFTEDGVYRFDARITNMGSTTLRFAVGAVDDDDWSNYSTVYIFLADSSEDGAELYITAVAEASAGEWFGVYVNSSMDTPPVAHIEMTVQRIGDAELNESTGTYYGYGAAE